MFCCLGEKPSAGKSTFFNATTQTDDAKVAAFPFTTIEPNIGRGYFSSACPSKTFQVDGRDLSVSGNAFFGYTSTGGRKIPIIVKDVAGLVPGAYTGRGRGNAFLNDLCDANVFIHVVDASGTTDRTGVQNLDGKHDPIDDIGWVRLEIHRWIYANVRHKWSGVRRRSERFFDLFGGYIRNCRSHGMVTEALSRMGIDVKDLDTILPQFTAHDLHRFVAHFLRVRFPMFLALNKADLKGTTENIYRIKKKFPNEKCLPVCAAHEWGLLQLRRQGLIDYIDGDEKVKILIPRTEAVWVPKYIALLETMEATVFSMFGSTGILNCMTAAVRYPQNIFDLVQNYLVNPIIL